MNQKLFAAITCAVVLPAALLAQSSTYNQVVAADTFVSSGDPNSNFGSQGAMEIAASTTAQPRTQITLLRFDTSSILLAGNADYGAGNWVVTGVTLSLFSNVATAGQQPNNSRFNKIAAGSFEFNLLGNNAWSESGITWNNLPDILPGSGNSNTSTPLGTFFWAATGSASSVWSLIADPALVNAINHGSEVTILGQPSVGSAVGYLMNTFPSNPGYLNVTVQAVPESSILTLVASMAGCWIFRWKKTRT